MHWEKSLKVEYGKKTQDEEHGTAKAHQNLGYQPEGFGAVGTNRR